MSARLGVAPEQVVLVDDVPVCVGGARAYGMRGILFRDNAGAIAEVESQLTGTAV